MFIEGIYVKKLDKYYIIHYFNLLYILVYVMNLQHNISSILFKNLLAINISVTQNFYGDFIILFSSNSNNKKREIEQ